VKEAADSRPPYRSQARFDLRMRTLIRYRTPAIAAFGVTR
jgi:hypothetical protein